MGPEDRPRGCWRFFDDYRSAGRMAWEQCKPPLLVIAVGLFHLPVFFHPRLGDYRWIVLGLGALSVVGGVVALHMLMLGQDRLAILRTRSEARAARRAEAEDDSAEDGSEGS